MSDVCMATTPNGATTVPNQEHTKLTRVDNDLQVKCMLFSVPRNIPNWNSCQSIYSRTMRSRRCTTWFCRIGRRFCFNTGSDWLSRKSCAQCYQIFQRIAERTHPARFPQGQILKVIRQRPPRSDRGGHKAVVKLCGRGNCRSANSELTRNGLAVHFNPGDV